MRITKKLIAIFLCVAMIPLALFTGFAEESESTPSQPQSEQVLYHQKFDGTLTDLADSGLTVLPADVNENFIVKLNENNYLMTDCFNVTTKAYRRIALPNRIPEGTDTYTVQLTFRFADASLPAYGGVQVEWGYGTAVNKDLNLRYGGDVVGYQNNALSADMKAALKAKKNGESVTPGEWIHWSIAVQEGKLGASTVTVGENSITLTEVADDRKVELSNQNLYLKFVQAVVEIEEIQITAPAEPSTDQVVYTQKFDSTVTDLDATGWKVYSNDVGKDFKVSLNEEHYLLTDCLNVTNFAYRRIQLPDVLKSANGNYSIELVFRFSDPKMPTFGGVQLEWGVGGKDLNLRYGGDVVGYDSSENKLSDEIKDLMHASDTAPGEWVSWKVTVEDGMLGTCEIRVGDQTAILTKVAADRQVILPDELFLKFVRSVVEIRELTVTTPNDADQPQKPDVPVVTLPSGQVLYYQLFDKSFGLSSITEAGLSDGSNNYQIDSDGCLAVNTVGTDGYMKCVLPDVVPAGLQDYTLETVFRFVDKTTYSHGGVQIGFGEKGSRGTVDFNLRYNFNGGQFDRIGSVDTDVQSAWLADAFGPGGWITLKIEVKDGCLKKVSIEVNDPLSGISKSWSTESPSYTRALPAGQIYLMENHAGVQFRSLRVVAGVDYTEYSGEYANKSYSGNEDPAPNTDDPGPNPPDDTDTDQPTDTTAPTDTGDRTTTSAPAAGDESSGGCKSSAAPQAIAVLTVLFVGIACIPVRRRKKNHM